MNREQEVKMKMRWDIDPITLCWNWRLWINPQNGYGIAAFKKKRTSAHRAIFLELIGDIPSRMQLDHLCQNRRCVNPAHLEIVSAAENTRRSNSTSLMPSKVSEIKKLRIDGHSLKDIAAQFGISKQSVCDITKGRSWKEIKPGSAG